jgi:thiamine transport system ATP-binding protein
MLIIDDVSKSFGTRRILSDISLSVGTGEIMALLGASGSGKSTLLRCVAGLEVPEAGIIVWDGKAMNTIPAHERGFGMVFQDFALFPHMTVGENIRFGLRMQQRTRDSQAALVTDLLATVGLSGYHDRSVDTLSGGERQRVALARSLAPGPRLLMLDEPLGSLDTALRERLATEVREILAQQGMTALYVTHDLREAFAVADKVSILHDGRLEQTGSPHDLYARPRTAYAARLMGLDNILPARVLGHRDAQGEVLLHPHWLSLDREDAQWSLDGVVSRVTYEGWRYRILVELSAGHAIVLYSDGRGQPPETGARVSVTGDAEAVIPLEALPAGQPDG